MRKTKLISLLISTVVILVLTYTGVAFASMKCGTHLITAGQRQGLSKIEVEKRCGAPYEKSGNRWLYVKRNTVYRLQFNENTGLIAIHREMSR